MQQLGIPATAVILAGGKSTRMGCDKSMMPYMGRPIIEYMYRRLRPNFDDLLIAANDPLKFAFLDVDVSLDLLQNQGPIMAIISALETSASDYNFFVACDSPALHLPFIRSMVEQAADYDCVVPVDKAGRYEPLFAVYRKSALKAAWRVFNSGQRKISRIYPYCRTAFISLPENFTPINLNTPSQASQLLLAS